jgi:hypothetical protein
MNDKGARKERECEVADRREDAIRALIGQRTSALSANEVEEAALELGISRATLYRMLAAVPRYWNCFVASSARRS